MSLSVINTVARTPHRYILRPRKQIQVKSFGFDHLVQETRPQNTVSLVSLPTELLTEIISFMTWKDILHLRATSKCLLEATKTRAIWSNLVSDHITTTPCPPLLELPISFYDSRELERLYLLWKSAEIGWCIPDVKPSRERLISVGPIRLVHLIKGGRWLLVTNAAGAVTYYDLDAKTVTGVPLIADQLPTHRSGNGIVISIDINQKSPMLNFTIAFALTDDSVHTHLPPSQIQLWDIGLVLDKSRHAVGLSAGLLASFPLWRNPSIIMEMTLLGRMIAFSSIDLNGSTCAYIINWVLADGKLTMLPWKILDNFSYCGTLHLLPLNKLLVCQNGLVSLYSYSDTCNTHCASGNNPAIHTAPCHHLWDINMEPRNLICSRLERNTAHIHIISKRFIHSIEIDIASDSDQHPPVCKMTSHSPEFCFRTNTCLGHNRVYSINHDQKSATLVRYADGTEFASSARKYLSRTASCALSNCPLMDKGSGRVVHFTTTEAPKLIVVDFALASQIL